MPNTATTFQYTRRFKAPPALAPSKKARGVTETDSAPGDRRRGLKYVFTPEIELAVNVALAIGRPLLVRGPSGTGKSYLAGAIADAMGRRRLEIVVTSRTEAKDLLWTVDLVRRLSDASSPAKDVGTDLSRYVVPGVLWDAFDPADAALQRAKLTGSKPPSTVAPAGNAVVLIDEIDKADPDTPNNLLVPLGSLRFNVTDLPEKEVQCTSQGAPLIVITTNEERELPPAFLRRCVQLTLSLPDRERLIAIGRSQSPDADEQLLVKLADSLVDATSNVSTVSPAEYVDCIRACKELEPDGAAFQQILKAITRKP